MAEDGTTTGYTRPAESYADRGRRLRRERAADRQALGAMGGSPIVDRPARRTGSAGRADTSGVAAAGEAVRGGDGFPIVPAYQQRTWHGLTWRQQGEVLRAARRGESHPDAALADDARRWAKKVLEPRYATVHGAIGVALAVISDTASGG